MKSLRPTFNLNRKVVCMPELRIKTAQDNGDLPKQLELDLELKD